MSPLEANELVSASGYKKKKKKKIWMSWKDKIEGTDRRKEKRKPVQTKLRKYIKNNNRQERIILSCNRSVHWAFKIV